MMRIVSGRPGVDLLVVTPLLTGHKISRDTIINLNRNDIKFVWISYESGNNIAKNCDLGIKTYREKYNTPKYVMMVDNDIIPSRHMLDKMHHRLNHSKDNEAFCYCNFEFKGTVNRKFYNLAYDPIVLIRGNFISSNSMIKMDKLDEIGGLVTDDKYKRLLDWCTWLKFLSHGYYGILCNDTSFVAISKESSVSSGSAEDYWKTHQLIHQDFVEPLVSGIVF